MDRKTVDREPPTAGRPSGRGDGGRPGGALRAQALEIAVDIAPVLLYTLVYGVTKNVVLAAAVSIAMGTVVTLVRLVQHRAPWRSLAALALVVTGGLVAGFSGEASGYFLPQILLGMAGVVIIVVLILAKLPPAGLVMSLLTGEGLGWRRCPARRRAYSAASVVLVAMPLLGLAANIPLYIAHNIIGLGVVDMLNPIANVLVALVAWRVYRRVLGDHKCPPTAGGAGG